MKTAVAIALALVWTASPSLAQSCFEPDPLLVVGDSPTSAAFADLDGDGDVDMGVTGGLRVDIFWNAGDGTWGSSTGFDATYNLTHIDFADVDGDGDKDALYTNGYGVHTLNVRRNLGAQAFGAEETYAVSWVPEHFVCADLDHDTDLDIAVACSGAGYGGIGVAMFLRNQGNGTFVWGQGLVAGGTRVAVADFDVDGDRDIAVVRGGGNTFYVAVNDGQGSFPGALTPITLGAVPIDVVAGDFNLDGRPDLAVAQEGNRVSIVMSTSGGNGFAPYVEYPTPHGARAIEMADFDVDGDLDLAVLDWVVGGVTVLSNAGNGTFAVAGTHAPGGTAYTLTSGDVDGDGDPDIALTLYTVDRVRVLRNCASIGAPTCFGDGSATACPCGNASPVGADSGCLHSLGTGGTLRASGIARISADSLALRGASMPNAPALYFQGTSSINGGLGSAFGDGLRCAGGTVARLGTAMNSGGASQYPGVGQPPVSVVGGVTVPGERHYQVWYRNAAASFCTPVTFNLTNSLRLTWQP